MTSPLVARFEINRGPIVLQKIVSQISYYVIFDKIKEKLLARFSKASGRQRSRAGPQNK